MDIGRIREELVPLQPPFPCVAGRMKRIHQQDFQTSQEGYVSLVGEVGVPPPRVIESDGCFSMTLIGTCVTTPPIGVAYRTWYSEGFPAEYTPKPAVVRLTATTLPTEPTFSSSRVDRHRQLDNTWRRDVVWHQQDRGREESSRSHGACLETWERCLRRL